MCYHRMAALTTADMPNVNKLDEDERAQESETVFCSHLYSCDSLGPGFLSRVSILTRDIDIANMSVYLSVRPSVRYVPVSDESGLT